MKKSTMVLIAIDIVIFALIAIIAVSFLFHRNKTPTWQEQYDLGVRYLSEGNYQEAIIAFIAAIEIDPMRPEAYLKAAEAYEATGNNEAAKTILEKGYSVTGDGLLRPQETTSDERELDESNSNTDVEDESQRQEEFPQDEDIITPSLTEDELKSLAESRGTVSAWEYADYDGDGTNEAFAIITEIDSHPNWGDLLNVLETLFISSDGTITIMDNNLNLMLYVSDDGYIRYKEGKGFFWADIGGGGSGWTTVLYSVTNNAPYKLQLSGKIQGFYENEGVLYTTESEYFPGGGHWYPTVELLYDSNTQEFVKGARLD